MAPLNILIVGCSIAGPTLATFLLLADLPAAQLPSTTILERSSSLRTAGQNIDIRGAGVTIIRKLGLETEIRAATTGEEGVQLVDKENRIWAAFAADRTGRTSTPTADIEILRGRLAEILLKKSKVISQEVQRRGGAGIEYLFGDCIDELDQDGSQVHVHFAKIGLRRSFDLVVGADGLQSSIRRTVWGTAGEKDRVKRLDMYIGFFSMPKAKTDSAWRRWFHAPGRRGIMLRPSDTKDRTTALVSVINKDDERLMQVAARGHEGVEAQKRLLAEYMKDAGWESGRVIQEMLASKDFYYDLVGQVKMNTWSKGRVVLLGDAGYCASPISGMGTTLAMCGAYTLAGALVQHPNDHPAACMEYEAKMLPTVTRAQKLAPGMPYLINPETAWGVWMLNAIMYVLYQSGVIKMLATYMGPPAHSVKVEEYGFRGLAE